MDRLERIIAETQTKRNVSSRKRLLVLMMFFVIATDARPEEAQVYFLPVGLGQSNDSSWRVLDSTQHNHGANQRDLQNRLQNDWLPGEANHPWLPLQGRARSIRARLPLAKAKGWETTRTGHLLRLLSSDRLSFGWVWAARALRPPHGDPAKSHHGPRRRPCQA